MLSIIIINFRSAALIVDCIHSILTETSTINYEIIVVDNSDSDDDRQYVLSHIPSVKWLNMGYNAGFARANNVGIKMAQGDILLLLNPDTLIQNNAIENCYKAFIRSDYVACGVQLLNEDGSPQISGNFAMRGGLNYLLPLPYIGAFLKWLGQVAKVKKPNVPDASTIVEVDWINGAFLMSKKKAVESAGLLDEDFFLYAEEAEWCSRLRKEGNLCIYGDYKVIHLQGETANDAFNSEGKGYYNLYDRKGLQIMLSNFVRIRKEFGIFWFLFDLSIYTFTIPILGIGTCIDAIFRSKRRNKNRFSKITGFTKNVFRLWSYLPFIILKKPYFYKVLI